MDFNFVTNIETCYDFIKQGNETLKLVYYSHIPIIFSSLLVGFFVFFKDRKSLIGKILLCISTIFSLWLILDLTIWTSTDSRIIMLSWAILEILSALFFMLSLYFVYVFIDKKDISFIKKIILSFLLLPLIIFTTTRLNITNFDISICEAVQSNLVINYIFSLEALISIWLIILVISRYMKADKLFRKQILILSVGMVLFLLSFFISDFIATKFENFKLEQGGFFGMVIFLGFLAYLIVKFKAFNIKLIGSQALVVGLVILVGSQFFFAQNTTSIILTGITLALSIGFGYILIKSIKLEVERKEQLQFMSDQLAKANDQLRTLDNAKSDFISIASHQLRTPLTSIKGFVSLMLEGSYGKITPMQQETLNKVYQSNERLTHLVEDLLDISRIESGRMEFQFAPCQLSDLCQEVADSFSIRAKNSKLYLNYEKPDVPLPEIMIDAGKVREVISNLVDNALKYTPKGGVTLRVELAENSNYQPLAAKGGQNSENQESKIEGKVLRITVSDTGIGIPAAELPYLFSKFSRGKDTGRLNVSGTGLGLYVGKSMLEANGGKIWAESKGENLGSRFIIELPVEQSKKILEQWAK